MRLLVKALVIAGICALLACSPKVQGPLVSDLSPIPPPQPLPEPRPRAPDSGFEDLEEGLLYNWDYVPILDLIERARFTLHIEIYTVESTQVRNALLKAARRGVKIRMVLEPRPAGSSCEPFAPVTSADSSDCSGTKKFVQDLRSSGDVVLEPFEKLELCAGTIDERKKCFQHGKLLIADASVAILSTGNWNDTNLCFLAKNPERCNRDYTYLLKDGAVIATLVEIVVRDLNRKAYDLNTLIAPVRDRLTVSPLSLAPLQALVKTARNSVWIQNQYMNDPFWNQTLIETSRAGIEVRLNVASACSFGKPSQFDRDRWNSIYSLFDQAGTLTRAFTKKMAVGQARTGYLHAKTILVDLTDGWVGSVNGSINSTSRNREFGVFFKDARSLDLLQRQMQADFTDRFATQWQESLGCVNDL
jgi:phosphatidylserine/phosphatidylglycerophosphate/cardiolipin synthase-like enzyme